MINDCGLPDAEQASASRPVTREAELQTGFLGMDSLYLVLEYPSSDIYETWLKHVDSLSNPRLYSGVAGDDFVFRRGALGYKLSVWDGDARLFLTDQVEDRLIGKAAEGQGMGIMLQLGPKWLRKFGDLVTENRFRDNVAGQFMAFGVGNPLKYLCRINRLDIALDVLGLPMDDLAIDDWRRQWVGYGAPSSVYFNRRTRKLETLTVGTSHGAVRFKVYDKQAESVKNGSSGFWRSVWGLPDDDDLTAVARFEWTVKCYSARFAGMRYLSDFTFDGFLEILNYVTRKWGSLREPQANDSNPNRWPVAPLWQTLRELIDDWSIHYDEIAGREYDYQPDLTSAYLRAAAGWIAGLRARIGIENGTIGPANLFDVVTYLDEEQLSIEVKAKEKWALLDRLARGRSEATDEP